MFMYLAGLCAVRAYVEKATEVKHQFFILCPGGYVTTYLLAGSVVTNDYINGVENVVFL